MKKLVLLATFVCGVSFGSMAADGKAQIEKMVKQPVEQVLIVQQDSLLAEHNEALVKKPLFNMLFDVCGHQEYVCCLTFGGAVEYGAFLTATYC
ncbi:hypothetical protein [Hymenobacter psychrophilus]|uniref:hypothetical protein n=1 Tax=Hymenobacter psychrophilus TaxID=651662 RepID=UPI001114E822|nr:hypothetical protein [Hymenobacter psychrophilus]